MTKFLTIQPLDFSWASPQRHTASLPATPPRGNARGILIPFAARWSLIIFAARNMCNGPEFPACHFRTWITSKAARRRCHFSHDTIFVRRCSLKQKWAVNNFIICAIDFHRYFFERDCSRHISFSFRCSPSDWYLHSMIVLSRITTDAPSILSIKITTFYDRCLVFQHSLALKVNLRYRHSSRGEPITKATVFACLAFQHSLLFTAAHSRQSSRCNRNRLDAWDAWLITHFRRRWNVMD